MSCHVVSRHVSAIGDRCMYGSRLPCSADARKAPDECLGSAVTFLRPTRRGQKEVALPVFILRCSIPRPFEANVLFDALCDLEVHLLPMMLCLESNPQHLGYYLEKRLHRIYGWGIAYKHRVQTLCINHIRFITRTYSYALKVICYGSYARGYYRIQYTANSMMCRM